MNYKKFEKLVKEHGFKFYDKAGAEKLERAITDYLKTENPEWFGDFNLQVNNKDISGYLEKVQSKQKSFNIDNIYKMLRNKFNLSKNDSLEIKAPMYLVDEHGFSGLKEKGQELYKKRIQRRFKGNQFGEEEFAKSYMKPITHPASPELEKKIQEGYKDLYCNATPEENLAKEYLKIAGNLPIAFSFGDLDKAIDFFENETGILVSKPKKDKKFVF